MKTFPLIAAALAVGCVSVETVAADAGTKIDPGQTNEPLRVALTFDDSLKDHLLIAAPMLEERGWRGTFCIVTDWVGKDSSKLTWDDVRELVRRGHEIATHTKTHRDLVDLLKAGKEDEVRRELDESVDVILRETGVAPRFMFSPGVHQNDETARICCEAGLRQTPAIRRNFGASNPDKVVSVVEGLIRSGKRRVDILHHGVSKNVTARM